MACCGVCLCACLLFFCLCVVRQFHSSSFRCSMDESGDCVVACEVSTDDECVGLSAVLCCVVLCCVVLCCVCCVGVVLSCGMACCGVCLCACLLFFCLCVVRQFHSSSFRCSMDESGDCVVACEVSTDDECVGLSAVLCCAVLCCVVLCCVVLCCVVLCCVVLCCVGVVLSCGMACCGVCLCACLLFFCLCVGRLFSLLSLMMQQG